MSTLFLKPLALFYLSLLFVIVVSTQGYETTTIAQPPTTVLPPAQAPHHHKGAGHHHHKHPPTAQPPAHPPTAKPPTHHAPAPTPAKPPVHPVKPPVQAPVKPPTHSPVKPPTHAPVKPPTHAPTPLPVRKLVAVQGVVYCKPCNYTGVETLLGATPLLGAVVKLQCNNTKYPLVVQTKTDKNGFFFINAPKTITTYGAHKCKVFLVSSPEKKCDKPTNLRYGVKGALLSAKSTKPPPVSAKTPAAFDLFNVGPFAFEPSVKKPCVH